MEDERKRLIDTFEKLDPLNRAKVLSRADLILNIQESTKKRILELINDNTQYADRRTAPVGAPMAKEAIA